MKAEAAIHPCWPEAQKEEGTPIKGVHWNVCPSISFFFPPVKSSNAFCHWLVVFMFSFAFGLFFSGGGGSVSNKQAFHSVMQICNFL